MEEIKKLIAFVFQRAGKESMKEKDFYMTLAFQLGWLTPGEGLKIIEHAIEQNLLIKKGDEITPAFDFREEDIPLGFKFDSKSLQEMEKELLPRILGKIMREKKIGEKGLKNEIEKKAEKLGVYAEIAAMVVAKEKGVDVDEFMDDAKKFLKMKD